jgi:anion-transporting  ArsA/GET3 family ATPase
MGSPLARRLVVVTGKGGAGKSTISAALGLLAADRGLRTIVVEVGEQQRLAELFGVAGGHPGVERRLRENLWSISIDPDRALLEWLQQLGGRVSGRILATSSTFHYFAAAAPGAKELVSMVKLWELAGGRRRAASRPYELVLLDAPATGHALAMLQSPATFGAIARVGTVAVQTRRVRELLCDPQRTSYVAVAQAAEMSVTETLELERGLERTLGRKLGPVIVNGLLPRRFSAEEIELLERAASGSRTGSETLARAAAAARTVYARARAQRNQLERLRRRFEVVTVPFEFCAELDRAAVERIARRLQKHF